MRAHDLIGQTAYDADGKVLGKVADLIVSQPAGPYPTIDAVLITPRHRGRLLGYERTGMEGPWLIEQVAALLHRGTRSVPWSDVSFDQPPV
jgi:sporulation protein YlmC with PRC-barrel domain